MGDSCTTCPFRGRTRVDFDGPVDAKLALLGEAPAYTEVQQKKPFVGNSGLLLNQFFEFFKIPREQLRVGNVILCGPIDSDKEALMKQPAPPGSNVGSMFEHALACCAERRELEGDLQSQVVLSLGVSATWGLLGQRISLSGKRPKRGALFHDWKGRSIFPTWHPAMLLKAGGQGESKKSSGKTSDAEAQSVAYDLIKAWKYANGEIERFKFSRCDPQYTVEFCEAARKRKQLIAVDVEASGVDKATALDALQCNLTIVGIAVQDKKGILVLSLWWPDATPEQQQAVQALLADPNVPKVGQNFPYDKTVLARHDLPVLGPTDDTLLLHHAIAPECDHDLSSIACCFLVTNPWKAEYYAREDVRKRRAIKDIPDELEYNAHDAAATLAITPPLKHECEEYGVLQVAEFDTRLAEVARWMRIWGVPIDADVRAEIGTELTRQTREARGKIEQMAIEAVYEGHHPKYTEAFLTAVQKTKRLSLASPFQLAALMDLLEVPVPAGSLTPTGKRSTRNEIIATIGHPFTRALGDYRTNEKLVSTFVEGKGLKLGEDSRIHPDWRVHAAVTGRWASTPMFLNWKKDTKHPERSVRRMVVAPKGRIFCGMDMSQLEFRIIALLAGQEDLLEALSDSTRDVHAENTARLYPKAWQDLTANMEKAKSRMAELEQLLRNAKTATDLAQFEILLAEAAKQYKFSEVGRKRLREVTKRATYACLYGSTAENLFLKLRSDEKLRDMGIEITLEQCQFFVQMFPKLWPRIEAWRQQAVVDATSSRETVSALLGRKRPFPLGRMDPTQATNFPIQSTGADIVGLGVLDLWDKMDRERDWLILQIHDAIVVETDEDRAEVVAGLMTQCMTCEVEINGYKCLFPCETRIGKSWDVV